MTDKYKSIRSYNAPEAKEAFYKLLDDRGFKSAIEICIPYFSVEALRNEAPNIHTVDDFQNILSRKFVDFFVQESTSYVHYSGADKLDDRGYLFIANHRDIAFDSALLQGYFFRKGRKTTNIAVGDNLISTPLLEMVAKINKMFLVKRSVSIREKLVNYQLLSDYIHHLIIEKKESVWIAQRDGRTKDGTDKTKQGLVKMLAMSDDNDPIAMLRKMRVTPVTVSYEYEPCDNLKARELALSENTKYLKQPGEDFQSIKQGVFGFKGETYITIGEPIEKQLDTIPSVLSNNDKICEVCKLIDYQIYKNYKLFANNYIAYDLLYRSEKYSKYYSAQQQEKFIEYLDKQSVVDDVPKDKMMNYLLQIYANPVNNCHDYQIYKEQ